MAFWPCGVGILRKQLSKVQISGREGGVEFQIDRQIKCKHSRGILSEWVLAFLNFVLSATSSNTGVLN